MNQLQTADVRPISVGKLSILLFIYQCLLHLGGFNLGVKTFDKNAILALLDFYIVDFLNYCSSSILL